MNLFGHVTWQAVMWLFIFALGTYVFFSGVLFFTQSRLIYFPVREIVVTPNQIGLSYEEVSFKTQEGVKLSGWYIPASPSRGVILFCHGNAGNISHCIESIEIFHSLGFSTFIFDYRGYGLSNGRPSEQGTYRDTKAAMDYLVREKELTPSEIIIFGQSLGGAVAVWLASRHTPKALILESTFTSVPDMAAALYSFLPARLLCRYDYNALAAIRDVSCPVLIVHSPEDEIVPFSQGRQLFDAANQPKVFLEVSGGHNEGFLTSGQTYVQGLNAFLESVDQQSQGTGT